MFQASVQTFSPRITGDQQPVGVEVDNIKTSDIRD